MSNDDLDTAVTEYSSCEGNLEQQRKVLRGYERAFNEASNRLVEAIIEAGLTEYGPITSSLQRNEFTGTVRRVWSTKAATGQAT